LIKSIFIEARVEDKEKNFLQKIKPKSRSTEEYSADNYFCFFEMRNFNLKFICIKRIEESVSLSAGDLDFNNATQIYDNLKDNFSNVWICIYFQFIHIITFIKNYI
jgi:hypothetical protein